MRVIFAGGGTGGHLYPGLAIARALVKADPRVEPFFIGARRGIEKDVLPQVGFPFELLDLHPLYRSRPWENWKTIRGAMTAWRRIAGEVRSEPPACVVGTGGYAAGLALAYAARHGIPLVLQEQNTYPGITARFFSRFAAQVHLGFPEARRYLSPSKKTEVYDSGNPIEPPPADAFEKAPARAKWGFPALGGAVLLVYGGSQGSQAMNNVVSSWIDRGLPSDLFVIWATDALEYLRIDDPIGAVPVHMVCGIWGTVSLGLFATGAYGVPTPTGADISTVVKGLFYGGGATQLVSQVIGSGAITIATLVVASSSVGWMRNAARISAAMSGEASPASDGSAASTTRMRRRRRSSRPARV